MMPSARHSPPAAILPPMSRARAAVSVVLLALQQRRPGLFAALRRLWWLLRHRRLPPAEGEALVDAPRYLEHLRRMTADAPAEPAGPLVRFLLFGSDPARLQCAMAAVQAQTQSSWQLHVLAPAACLPALQGAGDADRVVLHALPAEESSPCRWMDALAADAGDWIGLLAEGQQPAPQALARFRQHLAAAPDLQLWYCDEQGPDDTAPPLGRTVWDPLRLAAENTVGRFFLLQGALWQSLAGQRPCRSAEPLHDLLRALAPRLSPQRVGHSPLVLVRGDQDPAAAQTAPALPEPAGGLSVLVPTRDGLPHLAACVDSVLAAFDATQRPAELLIIDNGSCRPETATYFEDLGAREAERVRVLRYDRPFNYAAINNWAAQQARHELLLLLNDDIEARSRHWLPALLRQLQPGVGAVGARLLYPDGRIQHAGIAIGLGGVAGHPGRGLWPQDPVLQRWDTGVARQMSAVTGACLLTRKSLYLALEGLDAEHLAVAFNDVDYCLRLGRAGHRVVYTPEATLIHHESISRGADDDLAKQQRFAAEIAYMRRTWSEMIDDDPYYSPHWSLKSTDLSLRWPARIPADRCRRGQAG